MSVVLELSMFPLDKGESVSTYVSEVVKIIKEANVDYRLSAMGTIIETDNIHQALALVGKACDTLDELGCNRVYSVVKFDVRKGDTKHRLSQKIQSVADKIGHVDTTRD